MRGKISYQIGNLTRGMTGGVEDALRYGYVSSGWEKKTSAKVMAQSGLEEKLSQDEVQRYLDAARNVYGVEVEIHPDAQYSTSEDVYKRQAFGRCAKPARHRRRPLLLYPAGTLHLRAQIRVEFITQ